MRRSRWELAALRPSHSDSSKRTRRARSRLSRCTTRAACGYFVETTYFVHEAQWLYTYTEKVNDFIIHHSAFIIDVAQ